jgi:hypothetical protein
LSLSFRPCCLDGELAPDALVMQTARERGRHRRPSDAGLPASILAVAPVTEVDELTVGLESELGDIVGVRALAQMDAEAAVEAAEAAAAADAAAVGAAARAGEEGDWEFTDGPQQLGMGWAQGRAVQVAPMKPM